MEQIENAEINSGPQEQMGEATTEIPYVDATQQENQDPPAGTISPPSYAEMTKKKKLIYSPGSSKEDSFE